ncbi:hypothetical protein [Pandoraea sp. ISTKB]|uniref:hypothetical protein n=1 Tax=Pandoraea sp. ISTKB TaxID=1586708 RepID=UPI000846A170|nr:hypothetical protein [Pandoraea sp. ISTKB]ODP35129.1 hypothetical protein A9762_12290 [Pandoraea sp. ISTKB]
MNCDCISTTEKRIEEKFSAELGADIKATCTAAALAVRGNALETCLYTRFKLTGNAKGYTRGKEITMIASFCPFCGEPTKPKEENQSA